MVWFKVDDNLAFHSKALIAGNAAMGLWVRAGSWCSHLLTDGYVPAEIAETMGTRGEIRRLVTAKLWIEAEGGYQFWQWNEDGRQPTRDQVETDRRAAADRQRKAREAAKSRRDSERDAHSDKTSDKTSDSTSDSTVTDAGTHVEVQAPSRSPRPDPTRPVSTSTAGLGGNRTEPDARKRPPSKCPKHANDPAPPPCAACADHRRTADAWHPPTTATPADRPAADLLANLPEHNPELAAAGSARARAALGLEAS